MPAAIIITIGYDSYVLPSKPGVAGKLLELLGDAVPCRRDYEHKTPGFRECYRIQPKRAQVTVQTVDAGDILPPKPEDFEGEGVVELKALPTAVRLLKR